MSRFRPHCEALESRETPSVTAAEDPQPVEPGTQPPAPTQPPPAPAPSPVAPPTSDPTYPGGNG